ncbi:MAG: hypothetical protein ACFFG0_06610 [Candidatus Thorarchaeota archaeon]
MKKKNKVKCLVVFFVFSIALQVFNMNLLEKSIERNNHRKDPHLADATFTKQWLNNTGFSSPQYWYSSKEGDESDVDAIISDGEAKFKVIGDSGTFSLAADPPQTEWINFTNPKLPVLPDIFTFDQNGLSVEHKWDGPGEQLENNPSIHFKQNITMPINMSDFTITSASIQMSVNATVTVSPISGGIEREGDCTQYLIGDSIRFYVLISDVNNINSYPIAEYKTTELGKNEPPIDKLNDTYLIAVPEEILISYLTSILKIDNYNFTITLGIDIYCEDNLGGMDRDYWDEIRINYFKLNFTYEKKIDQFTSLSWNQDGNKPSDISGNPIMVNDAILYFKYKTNDTLPKTASLNSEIKVLINGFQHTETIKLWEVNASFQDVKNGGGFDVSSLIHEDKEINLSLQFFLADEFKLNRSITFSIDDVYLNITYTEQYIGDPTTYQLFLNRVNKTDDPVVSVPLGENLNITIRYCNQTRDHIPGAIVQLEGKVNVPLLENNTLQQYSAMINTSNIGIGVSSLTITAQKSNYNTQSIPFFVEVTERETELLLFLDGIQKFEGDSIKVELDEMINATICYRDNISRKHLPNANIELLGMGVLNETGEQYNITIDPNKLDQGISALTIFAQVVNYKPQVIHFFIQVIERSTRVRLFLNNEDKTIDPVYNITIGKMLNISVKYTDNLTGNYIPDANLQLIGEELMINLTRDDFLEQHYIELNTTNLRVGVINLFTIRCQATNYQTKIIYPTISINAISTLLNMTSIINAEIGDDVTLEVELTNIDFGGVIKGAIVTYRWAYGQGEFIDSDNDGLYIVVIQNVPEGQYEITIFAEKSVEYEFEGKIITLIVSSPMGEPRPDWSWLIYLLIGSIISIVSAFGLYEKHYKYPPLVRKMRKLKRNIRKNKRSKPILLNKRETIVKNSFQKSLEILELEIIKPEKKIETEKDSKITKSKDLEDKGK